MKVLKVIGFFLALVVVFNVVAPVVSASQAEPAFLYEEGAKREPVLAAVMSGLLPGLGQLYNGENTKGLVLLVGTLVGVPLIGVVGGMLTAGILGLLTPVLYLGIAGYAAWDAYNTAISINEALGF